MASNELSPVIDEIQLQLDSDILDYGWLLQIARECGVAEANLCTVVYDAIVKLLEDGVAEIGDAKQVAGRTEIYPWTANLESRLKEVIDRFGTTPELGEGFWLSKAIAPDGQCYGGIEGRNRS